MSYLTYLTIENNIPIAIVGGEVHYDIYDYDGLDTPEKIFTSISSSEVKSGLNLVIGKMTIRPGANLTIPLRLTTNIGTDSKFSLRLILADGTNTQFDVFVRLAYSDVSLNEIETNSHYAPLRQEVLKVSQSSTVTDPDHSDSYGRNMYYLTQYKIDFGSLYNYIPCSVTFVNHHSEPVLLEALDGDIIVRSSTLLPGDTSSWHTDVNSRWMATTLTGKHIPIDQSIEYFPKSLNENVEISEGPTDRIFFTVDMILYAAEAYGISITREEATTLHTAMPMITREGADGFMRKRIYEDDSSYSEWTTGMVLGFIIGGVAAYMMSLGSGGVGIIAFLGAGMGAQIGENLAVHSVNTDPTNTINASNSYIRRTFFTITPAGGPYSNQKIFEDFLKYPSFHQIGSSNLPDAGVLYPPAKDGGLQIWLPTALKVAPYIINEDKYYFIDSVRGKLFMAIYVIIKVKGSNEFQLRLHPDNPYVHTSSRPNHSQLTQGSILFSLIFRDESMDVYAGGQIYCDSNRKLAGIIPQTGHYYESDRTEYFDAEVIQNTLEAFKALGYDISGVLTGNVFVRSLRGF